MFSSYKLYKLNMNTLTKFHDDDEITNHKIKALELNASQF